MRLAVIWIVLLSLVKTVHADPGDTVDVIDPGKAQRTHAKLVAAGAVALELASAGVCLYARVSWDDAMAHLTPSYTSDQYKSRQAYVDQANNARDLARYAGTGLFLAGAAALGTAAYLYWSAPERLVVRRVIVAPAVSGNQAGMALVGSF